MKAKARPSTMMMLDGINLHPRSIRHRIWSALLSASDQEIRDGMDFYPGAHGLCRLFSSIFGVTVSQVAGVYAALSPLNGWYTNVSNMVTVLRYTQTGRYNSGVNTTTPNEKNALRIACGEDPDHILRGKKVRAFYLSITDPENRSNVPVDRHLINLALGTRIRDNQQLRAIASGPSLYSKIESTYLSLGNREGLGNRLASIAWFVQRRISLMGDTTPILQPGRGVCCGSVSYSWGNRFYCPICKATRTKSPTLTRCRYQLPECVLTDSGNVIGILPISVDSRGRILVRYGKGQPYMNSGGYQYLSRYIVMKRLSEVGETLRTDEHVHHSNGLLWDCRSDNLEVWLAEDHGRHHGRSQLLYMVRDIKGRFVESEVPPYSEQLESKLEEVPF